MHAEVIIVGGGLAGLAAAVRLAEHGAAVTVLESRPRLGGRASSFVDRETQSAIDNCQHVSMGCCTNLQHFFETVGIAEMLRTESRLYFVAPDGTVCTFQATKLPAPLHLWSAFRNLSYLNHDDLRWIGRGLRALARLHPSDYESSAFSSWLKQHQQPQRVVDRFWHVVLVSALSESLDRIDVAAARKVFVDGFLANRRGWTVQIPVQPLDLLYGQRVRHWLSQHGTAVRLQTGAERLLHENGRITGVALRNGERVHGTDFIVAVPHERVMSLLPESLREFPEWAGISRLESAPISSVHLWFNRAITELPHAVFVERLSQWMFNRTALAASPRVPPDEEKQLTEGANLFYYQVVISASRNLAGKSQQEVIQAVLDDLTAVWPETARAELLHGRLITEHRAVFSPTPGSEALRPPQRTQIANLQLAGDWTKTGWPATMEGAVRSGYLAAENILRRHGVEKRLLQPDLPVSWLSKLLLGLQVESS